MEVNVNNYYLETLDDMIGYLERSTPGERRWRYDVDYFGDDTGFVDYSSTLRSTFPNWTKFFFEKIPKKQILDYKEVGHNKPFEDGYFHGSKFEFVGMLTRAKSGKLSRSNRLVRAFDLSIAGYFDFIKDWEQEHQETYQP